MNLGSMTRAAWLNTLLAGVVAALGLFVFLKPGTGVPPDYPLSTLKAEEARSMRIERPGAVPIVLEKRENGWFMTAPLAARADSLRVQRLLALAAARSADRLAATDLARFELERPAARLTIAGQNFDFGVVSPVSREQYILTGGAVYTVGLQYGAALPGNPAALIDKQLLSAGEVPVRFEFKDYNVVRDDSGKWTLRPPHGEVSQDDYQRWVDAWRHASALRVELYAMGKPLLEIKVEFRNGAKVALGLLASGAEVALLRPDEKLVYYFLSEPGQRLLSPPTAREDRAEKK